MLCVLWCGACRAGRTCYARCQQLGGPAGCSAALHACLLVDAPWPALPSPSPLRQLPRGREGGQGPAGLADVEVSGARRWCGGLRRGMPTPARDCLLLAHCTTPRPLPNATPVLPPGCPTTASPTPPPCLAHPAATTACATQSSAAPTSSEPRGAGECGCGVCQQQLEGGVGKAVIGRPDFQ